MKSEQAIVKRILDGDLNTFQDLVEQYQKLVVHVVYRMVSRMEDREEVCQEVFIKVYQNLAGFKFQSKLSTWIARIAYTTTINYLRKFRLPSHGNQIRTNLGYNGEDNNFDSLDSIHSDYPSPLETTEKQDMTILIQKKIKQLPAPYQMIISLYHLDQLSYHEIADIMDLPEGTIKSYLFRGRKKLKDLLVLELEGEEINV